MLSWLKDEGWIIVAYDYPQSGTGYSLHSKERMNGSKNIGAIIPDIVAVRNDAAIFFENKVDFNLVDIEAISILRGSGLYDDSISVLLKSFNAVRKITFGITLQESSNNLKKIMEHKSSLDFAFLINQDLIVDLCYGSI
ncbi:hypothetical protein G6659_03700 [Polynucleobacter paneuropaeus]|nr:hypothetical protein G6659_03700 [Polynucleobacter paneuropaeus]